MKVYEPCLRLSLPKSINAKATKIGIPTVSNILPPYNYSEDHTSEILTKTKGIIMLMYLLYYKIIKTSIVLHKIKQVISLINK